MLHISEYKWTLYTYTQYFDIYKHKVPTIVLYIDMYIRTNKE